MDVLSPGAAIDMILDYPAVGPSDGAFYTEAAPTETFQRNQLKPVDRVGSVDLRKNGALRLRPLHKHRGENHDSCSGHGESANR
jgi:hypothetical protein